MKILLLSPIPPPSGGIGTWTNIYRKSKIIKDHDLDIVNTSIIGKRIKDFSKKNIVDEIKRSIRIIRNTRKFTNLNKYDVCHVNTSCSTKGMLRDYLCMKTMNNIILHCHCDTNYMVKGKIGEYLFKKLCKKASKIIVLNKSSYDHIYNLTNIQSVIVPNFIDLEELDIDMERKLNKEIKEILYVGHVTISKGFREIIQTASVIKNKTFYLIGNVDEGIKNEPIPSNVKMIGEISRNEVINKMLNADLFIFPSYSEGFPNAVLEAMACGLPIVASKVGAIPDMIEDGGGLLVNPKDKEMLIDAVKRIEDHKIREKMSIWNKEKVRNCYTVDIVVKQIMDIYMNMEGGIN